MTLDRMCYDAPMDFLLIAAVYLVVAFLILAFNYGAHKNDQDDYEFYESGSSPQTNDALTYNGLPIVVTDEDFLEHLHEMGYGGYIDVAELNLEWNIWAIENLE
jgi:hypothetical protein